MNVPEDDRGLPANRADFPSLTPTALYLALPPKGREIAPADAYVELPEDGSPPPYKEILVAVARVLGNDPGGPLDFTAVTVKQARHVAREIAWNQKFRPLPGPTGERLGDLFTTPTDEKEDAERGRLEGQLKAYYAAGDADAERLTGFVVALITAVQAEKRSTAATQAGLAFPILPDQTGTGERHRSARVLLTALPPDARFTVPARYFYALGAGLPVTFDADQRYRSAILADDERLRSTLVAARDTGIVAEEPPSLAPGELPPGDLPVTDHPVIKIANAVRRLRALGDTGGSRASLEVTGAVTDLIKSYLGVNDDDINTAFWKDILTSQPAGHLELVLCALTRGYLVRVGPPEDWTPLRTKLQAKLGVANAAQAAAKSEDEWRQALRDDPAWPGNLPDFTLPGTLEERLAAFLAEVRAFFALTPAAPPVGAGSSDPVPVIRLPAGDPISRFLAAYAARAGAGAGYAFGGDLNNAGHRGAAIDDVVGALYGHDPHGRPWLIDAVTTLDDLVRVAGKARKDGDEEAFPLPLQFSLVEALYARGFTRSAQIAACTQQQLRDALVGTVAHGLADALGKAAGGPATPPRPLGDEPFVPVNPDGCLVDCIPPEHLSPLGRPAYLQALLSLPSEATCQDPAPAQSPTLGERLDSRRGPLGNLAVSKANTSTPLPAIDLVNEHLEHLAAGAGADSGVVHDTATEQIGGHLLAGGKGPTPDGAFRHDPTTLLGALPEHSTPARSAGYAALAVDVSHPLLPYNQPLDVNRSHLEALGTCRYEVMRAFRRDITELVLRPDAEPEGFRRHLWRYPLRLDLALEYLCLSRQEYDIFFNWGLVTELEEDQKATTVWEAYGFYSPWVGEGTAWTEVVVRVPEFLARTRLTWCDFVELWRAQIVPFRRQAPPGHDGGPLPEEFMAFPECEPCHLDQYTLDVGDDVVGGLLRLAVVIRLWRMLRSRRPSMNARDLADIAAITPLFNDAGAFNTDLIRQLAALQLLRCEFGVPLPTALSIWAGPNDARWERAATTLLDHVRRHAVDRLRCRLKPPEFLEVLAANLEAISRLAGFDPTAPSDTWHARPTHTLRFAEVLAKLYASDLGVGELLFLATTGNHLQGDDPFVLQSANQALDDPLESPDDDPHSLWALRERLLQTPCDDTDPEAWPWHRIETELRTRFAQAVPPAGPDPLYLLGARFFPTVLEAAGVAVLPEDRRWRVDLPGSSPAMWNTPPNGPFRYLGDGLTAQVPLREADVVSKLARIRQLDNAEQYAVRELLAGPRAVLAPFSWLFTDVEDAVRYLSQEPDEQARFRYVQRSVATAVARCETIAAHLAAHVTAATKETQGTPEASPAAAFRLLTQLHGDENRASGPWEDDSGHAPGLTWPGATGGAFAALLALLGTGLLGEYTRPSEHGDGGNGPPAEPPLWREMRPTTRAFDITGELRNTTNAPVPGLLPELDVTASEIQGRFVAIRNGFAISNTPGESLGGAQGHHVRWTGALLVEQTGHYDFHAGTPAPDGELPGQDGLEGRRWRIVLRRGQRTWVLLSRHWPGRSGSRAPHCTAQLDLRRGAYDLDISYVRENPRFHDTDDVAATHTGFQLAYAGPDTDGQVVAIPRTRLFRPTQDPWRLDRGLQKELTPTEQDALAQRYTGSLRDIRRTYQRAFKALLLAHRLGLSAQPTADDGQCELDYLLDHPDLFSGAAYPRSDETVGVHLADLAPDLLPVSDPYRPPDPAVDQRAAPSTARSQAITDWWERLYDYTVLRRDADPSPAQPAWLLFHESAEGHPDIPGDLQRHLGVDLRHTDAVRHYALPGSDDVELASADLTDERWPVRVQRADRLLRTVRRRFLVADIRHARPARWADDDPASPHDGISGNDNLRRFVADGLIENGAPRRYTDLADLDNGLRERGRAALLAYLTRFDRVLLPGRRPVRQARQLGELLLMDVEAGLCERVSRNDAAISALQTYVNRARLGLEPGYTPSPGFLALWDAQYASHHTWQACIRRQLYRENWVDIDEVTQAQRTEAFTFLTEELRRVALTRPEPGGAQVWAAPPTAQHPAIQLLQVRDPSTLQAVRPDGHGFDLLGTPDHHARPSWLAAVGVSTAPADDGDGGHDDGSGNGLSESPGGPDTPPLGIVALPEGGGHEPAGKAPGEDSERAEGEGQGGAGPTALPWWVKAPVRLGRRFLRIAAAGDPAASATPATLLADDDGSSCCSQCGHKHAPVVDEYYFWLEDARVFAPKQPTMQDSRWPWHDPGELPALLAWSAGQAVRLAWCRVHHGELGPVEHSNDAIRVGGPPQLLFTGRYDDSLTFAVNTGTTPVGFPDEPKPGFRFDLADGMAHALPQVPAAPTPVLPPPPGPLHPGGLPAFPYFVLHRPGAPLVPSTPYAAAVSVAGILRAHCHPEAALHWYALAFDPLHADASWLHCDNDKGRREPGTCCTDSTIADDEHVRRRAITMHYLETLLEWAQQWLHGTTPEAAAQARTILEAASRLLGERPRRVPDTDKNTGAAAPQSSGKKNGDATPTVASFTPHPAAPNPRLLSLYDRAADQLALVRACEMAPRLPRGPLPYPYTGDVAPIDGWREDPNRLCPCDDDTCAPASPYRFAFLVARARELAAQVRSLGSQLQQAFERGDAELLTALRTDQEGQLQASAVALRKLQWRDADWQVQALTTTKQIAQTNRRYFAALAEAGLNRGENDYQALTEQSVASHGASIPLEAVGQALGFIPDIWLGVAGLGPLNANQLPLGTKLAGVFATAARISGTVGAIAGITAGERLTQAGWERREEEWRHQVQVLDLETEQIERQILGAERRRDAALHELDDQQLHAEHAAAVQQMVRDRLTGHTLYLWLQQETAAVYRRTYELAWLVARQAQRAFNFERGHTAAEFLAADHWDGLHEGLLAGERLELDVRRMEQAYLHQNVREYELIKHVSLRLNRPLDLLRLQATGRCEVELPEWLFDQDYPGHYLRRIKNVSLTIPCVVGPYTGVHARLTLLSSMTRVRPELAQPLGACCPPDDDDWHNRRHDCQRCDDRCGCRPPVGEPEDGYTLRPDDPRAVWDHAARDAVATSTGQADAGLFEVSFRDERYLPFEFHGAVSRWLLELPQGDNQFDLATVSDVILHVSYTAREGGEALRDAARRSARQLLPGGGLRFLDVEHDLTDAWYALQRCGRDDVRTLPLRLSRSMFPFLSGGQPLSVTAVDVFVEAPHADPGTHHLLRYRPARRDRPGWLEAEEFSDVECVAATDWPGLFHGVLADVGPGELTDAESLLGTFELPPDLGRVCRIWLLCRYEARSCSQGRCRGDREHEHGEHRWPGDHEWPDVAGHGQ
ncbi:neuraminidase-like domain-containing protein [Streptomyces chartreusis]|uniref:Tc toxin subunit A-related protein n=1 Tax=Streptomyces chartreusis TaxID=1969 RepID=UPI0033E04FC7